MEGVGMATKKAKRLKHIKTLILAVSSILLTFLLIIQSLYRIDYYRAAPTYITSSVVNQRDATFPTFTMCLDSSESYKDDVAMKHGLKKTGNYNCGGSRNPGCPIWYSNISSVSPIELFQEITYDVDEMVKSINVQLLNPDANGQFKLELNGDELEQNVMPAYHRPFGRCYTLSLKQGTRDRGVRYVELNLLQYAKIYFHPPGQFISLNGRMGYKVNNGERVEAYLNYHEYVMLEKTNKNYDPNALDQNKFPTTCSSKKTYDDCIYGTLKSLMMEEAGCTVPYLPNVDNDICTDIDKAAIAFDIHWYRVTNQRNDCQTPCQFILSDLSKSSNYYKTASEDNSTSFKVFFQEKVSLSREEYIFPFLTLIADLGAYLTILLGVSVLDLIIHLMKFVENKELAKHLEPEKVFVKTNNSIKIRPIVTEYFVNT